MSERFLKTRLDDREKEGLLRSPRVSHGLVDCSSNDYLGFARLAKLRRMIHAWFEAHPETWVGSTGSRLISGHSLLCEELEERIAAFHLADAGLIFNSGYDANLGLFSSVPRRGDTILYDELAHASIRDGIRLSLARGFAFRHNDIGHLEERLRRARGIAFIAVESVYSMDGDEAPLIDIASMAGRYGAHLIVDEAHATGVFGPRGEGGVVEHRLQDQVFARVHTFGKALGTHGAIVLGSHTLKSYLINFARSFIYTTFMPPPGLVAVECAYACLAESSDRMRCLHQRIETFRECARRSLEGHWIDRRSAIQTVIVPGNRPVTRVASYLQSRGFDVRPIRAPTVRGGAERLRICVHAFNKKEELERLVALISLGLARLRPEADGPRGDASRHGE